MYTSMLFALAGDKVFFGTSPAFTSIIGSALILGAAITMAMQTPTAVTESKQQETGEGDEERGLMTAVDDGIQRERVIAAEEVPMRTIR